MERIYQSTDSVLLGQQELYKLTAFHEAGHAAAIYFGNKEKKLPPVFFEIQVQKPAQDNGHFFAKVVGGQLIDNFPASLSESLNDFTDAEKRSFECAFQADVMNLLVGPLAEAKYVADRDGEIFSPNLLSPDILKYYGGSSDVAKAKTYLSHFIADKAAQKKALQKLFHLAYQFVNLPTHWRAITNLARFILNNPGEKISCEEAVSAFHQFPQAYTYKGLSPLHIW